MGNGPGKPGRYANRGFLESMLFPIRIDGALLHGMEKLLQALNLPLVHAAPAGGVVGAHKTAGRLLIQRRRCTRRRRGEGVDRLLPGLVRRKRQPAPTATPLKLNRKRYQL